MIVADGSEAQGYLRIPASDIIRGATHQPEETLTWALQPLDDFRLEAERIEVYDTGTDARATVFESSGNLRHMSEPHVDIHRKLKADLAVRVADRLNRARAQDRFDGLVVVAPSAWLGLLRPHLDRSVQDSVVIELTKDYVGLPLHELTERLCDIFPSRNIEV
ncbi:MAG: host attachment protein [Asticcacaulis sp.]|nr:host attachment protein [Asticcacaulis sp.]